MTENEEIKEDEEKEQTQEEQNTVITIPILNDIKKSIEEYISINRLSTRVINLKNLKVPRDNPILKLDGSGKIREITFLSASKFGVYIKADKNEIFNKNSSYDDLNSLNGLTDDIVATASGANYVIRIKNINFTKSIEISMASDSEITALNVYCAYDIQRENKKEDKNSCKLT